MAKSRPLVRIATAAFCCGLGVLFCCDAEAQATHTCSESLVEAEAHYVEGSFDEVISTLLQCIQRDDVPVDEVVAAYRLIALANLRKGDVAEARHAIVQLLNEMPEYEPDPVRDIPSYVAMVNLVIRDMQIRIAETQPADEPSPLPEEEKDRRSWFQSNKVWLLAGGSAAVAGIIVALTRGGGDDITVTSLPYPPTLPD